VPPPVLILASASPRRAAILHALDIPFRAVIPSVDESLLRGEGGAAAAERLARAKAASVVESADLPVLAADTLVVCDGMPLGKPATPEEASRMLRGLAGRSHEVVTGVCVATREACRSGVETTSVTFAAMSEAEIAWYVATGEPLDKAGAYHVDGRGALFISAVRAPDAPPRPRGRSGARARTRMTKGQRPIARRSASGRGSPAFRIFSCADRRRYGMRWIVTTFESLS
jgi:nucleoside triphosphate pyrophosphatase